MKLINLLEIETLEEKKEAIASSPATNMTLHYDSDFKQVGNEGSPEFSFTISISSTGGKQYGRVVADSDESDKLSEGIKQELRKALRRFNRNLDHIVSKYKLQTNQ